MLARYASAPRIGPAVEEYVEPISAAATQGDQRTLRLGAAPVACVAGPPAQVYVCVWRPLSKARHYRHTDISGTEASVAFVVSGSRHTRQQRVDDVPADRVHVPPTCGPSVEPKGYAFGGAPTSKLGLGRTCRFAAADRQSARRSEPVLPAAAVEQSQRESTSDPAGRHSRRGYRPGTRGARLCCLSSNYWSASRLNL
jgi:hypothetical protein